MLISKFQLGLAVALATGVAVGFVWELRENVQLRNEVKTQATAGVKRVADLKQQLAKQAQRAAAAETEVATLLKAAKTIGTVRAPASAAARAATDTEELLNSVRTHASQLIKEGKLQEALDDYVKCYRELEAKRPGSPECQNLMGSIKYLARTFPAALVALAELRDSAMARWQAQPDRRELAFEIALLNERLDQGSRTLALYDAFPANDSARGSLAMIAFKSFVAAGRYEEALVGKSFGNMLNVVESGSRTLAGQPSDHHADVRRAVLDATLTNIEVLTGAGKTDDAKLLTEKLLAFDDSDTTRAAIQQHVERARQARR